MSTNLTRAPDSEFGALVDEFITDKTQAILVSIVSLVIVLAGVGIILFPGLFPPAFDRLTGRSNWMVFNLGITFILLGLNISVYMFIRSFVQVRAYEHGMVWQSLFGTKRFRWTDICTVVRGIQGVDRSGYAFVQITGTSNVQVVLMRPLPRLKELRELVEERTLPPLLEQVQQVLLTAKATFGPMLVDENGIEYKNRHYPWRDVETITTKKGLFKLTMAHSSSPVINVRLDHIPNVHVFRTLADSFRDT